MSLEGNLVTCVPGGPHEQKRRGVADARARQSRVATWTLVVILLSMSSFAVWSSQATARASALAAAASALSDEYDVATTAVAAEESLERKYRLEPGADVLARFDAAGAALSDSLREIRAAGDPSDRALVDLVALSHAEYLSATTLMFAAVDRGDTPAVLVIDTTITEPAFAKMEAEIASKAASHDEIAAKQFQRLLRVENVARWLTPAVFLVGLLFAALVMVSIRGYRRVLISERAQAIHNSFHDALTGLPNRARLADRCTEALGAGRTTGLLLVDIDRFQEINDTFGHHFGDAVLIQIGSRLREVVRDGNLAARIGADEFAVLLPDAGDLDRVVAVAAELRARLEAPFVLEGIDIDIEVSIGVVLSGAHGVEAKTLLQRADIAMNFAKSERLGIFTYEPGVDRHSPARLALLGDLRRALERDELVLHYQPKIDVASGAIVGAEALVRWNHPTRGLVMPDDFIPVAEQTGLIGPLTHYVLDAAIAQAGIWAHAGRPIPVSVNLSARNMLDFRLPDDVSSLLAAHGVPAELLELEVTESAIITNPVKACDLLERLAGLGVRISLDDFGAGYTSLSQLTTLPISEIKIDRSFVMSMPDEARNAHIVRSVVDLGHDLGLAIVAEGVETAKALAMLTDLGCDIVQGYYLSRPVDIDSFDLWCLDRPIVDRPARLDLGRPTGHRTSRAAQIHP